MTPILALVLLEAVFGAPAFGRGPILESTLLQIPYIHTLECSTPYRYVACGSTDRGLFESVSQV